MSSESPDDRDRVRAFAARESEHLQKISRRITLLDVLAGVLMAFGAALLGGVLALPERGDHPHLVALSCLCIVVALGLYVWKYLSQRHLATAATLSPTDAHLRITELEERNRSLDWHRNSLTVWASVLRNTQNSAHEFALFVNQSIPSRRGEEAGRHIDEIEKEFRRRLDNVVKELETARFTLFGYANAEEIYFFDIFELLRRDDMLQLCARAKHHYAEEHKRAWKVGEGHIGDCVLRKKPVRVNYKLTPREDYDPTPLPSDSVYFQCRISVPILAGDSRRHGSFGALCITSDVAERLLPEHVALCETLAFLLATFFYVRESAIRRLTAASRNHGRQLTDGALTDDPRQEGAES